ncbi:MAG: phosphomannomutase [Nitrospirae bacterium CG_4_10_14_0_8_um_filter_41_23]|nr:MAG: phosphomannomutase [Nitrospirae bacterium CG11_big_fil_rev_8_21_14_0_20_41_14]PIV42154.1 MAG: phosphomannomutase [Nitrospirae bacterium CG02_land_8_20_14_3_00_41_53]PIW86440.1 MAG: phosphomannomutase [Nitrospirae bacterium CG_4_8_14_3_um_filter_41_47]PIY87900.1 MAG: phosphomannomutase [Nitrospirae bacterium CG_4_10_14_0_8_um_filter_41_23]PJA80318.1 MAG: phosphomannomutase [Nitrospirae bacterium CG_4_9_14_3_um_filter_41_27]
MNDKIFREYDIRGIVGRDLNENFAFSLGKAFGTLIKNIKKNGNRVSVGRDGRISSERLAANIIKGIISTGIDVYDIGLCPTPLQYFSIHHLNLDGGIMVTGSHNPPEYNGFKLSIGKETIFGEEIQKLKDIIEKRSWSESPENGHLEHYDILGAYKDIMVNRFSYLSNKGYRRLKVVVDAGNGTGGIVAPGILEAMGCEVIPLCCEPDGRFPNHHPDPTVVENLKGLIKVTKEEGADIGVGYDGDADRIGIIDSFGDIVWGDQIMVILARDILKRKPDAIIIGDVKCSHTMFDDIERHGGKPIMWKTGHSLIKDKMRKEGALLAGEFSGHIFVSDGYFGFDDAIYTTFRLIEIMKTTALGINELLSDIPRMCSTPEIHIDCPEDQKKMVVERLVHRCKEYNISGNCPFPIKKIYDIDGARVVFEKGWGLIRSSNTQPVVVMRFEAEDEKSLNEYRNFLERELKEAMELL